MSQPTLETMHQPVYHRETVITSSDPYIPVGLPWYQNVLPPEARTWKELLMRDKHRRNFQLVASGHYVFESSVGERITIRQEYSLTKLPGWDDFAKELGATK